MSIALLLRWRVQFLFFPLVITALIVAAPVPLAAQRRGEVATLRAIQPRVILVLGDEVAGDSPVTREAQELLETTVEGHLRSALRYDLIRTRTGTTPEAFVAARADRRRASEEADAVVFARTAPRRDGSLRVELDLWRDGRFLWSQESELPLGRERFRVSAELAAELENELARSFPGFGRVAFRNTGVDRPYYVYVDGRLVGAGIKAIEFPQGTYTFEIRRRDEGFEHVVGRRQVNLRDDDFIELRFQMERDPPPVPGFLRLTDPADRWDALFDLRSAVMIPREGFTEFDGVGYGGFATTLFNDVLFRGHVFGFEVGYVDFRPEMPDSDETPRFESTSLMATTGISVGPVSRVDYIVRVGAGMALTRLTDTEVYTGSSPAFAGSMEFGFGFGRVGRLSLNIAYYGVQEDDEFFSFIGLGLGLGGRF